MLLNQHLYNRALIKQRLKKQKEELNVLSPRSTFDGLSINLQSELSDEKKPDEFKKVVIEDKKDKEKVDGDTEEKEVEEEVEEEEVEDDFDDLEIVQDDVDDDLEEDFELVQDEENDDLVQENKLLEGGFNNDSEKNKNDKNVKNVVLSFF